MLGTPNYMSPEQVRGEQGHHPLRRLRPGRRLLRAARGAQGLRRGGDGRRPLPGDAEGARAARPRPGRAAARVDGPAARARQGPGSALRRRGRAARGPARRAQGRAGRSPPRAPDPAQARAGRDALRRRGRSCARSRPHRRPGSRGALATQPTLAVGLGPRDVTAGHGRPRRSRDGPRPLPLPSRRIPRHRGRTRPSSSETQAAPPAAPTAALPASAPPRRRSARGAAGRFHAARARARAVAGAPRPGPALLLLLGAAVGAGHAAGRGPLARPARRVGHERAPRSTALHRGLASTPRLSTLPRRAAHDRRAHPPPPCPPTTVRATAAAPQPDRTAAGPARSGPSAGSRPHPRRARPRRPPPRAPPPLRSRSRPHPRTCPSPRPPPWPPSSPDDAAPWPPPPTAAPAATLPPPPAATAPPVLQSETAARQAIRGVLDEYRAAFERRDADALRSVQPGVDYEAMRKTFASVTGYTVRVDVKEVSVKGNEGRRELRRHLSAPAQAGAEDPAAEHGLPPAPHGRRLADRAAGAAVARTIHEARLAVLHE